MPVLLERVFWPNPPNASVFGAHSPRNLLTQVFRNECRMFHKPAVKIHNVERSVRTGGKVHRMEPGIGRGEKFLSAFTPGGNEAHTIRHQDAPMHQIAK